MASKPTGTKKGPRTYQNSIWLWLSDPQISPHSDSDRGRITTTEEENIISFCTNNSGVANRKVSGVSSRCSKANDVLGIWHLVKASIRPFYRGDKISWGRSRSSLWRFHEKGDSRGNESITTTSFFFSLPPWKDTLFPGGRTRDTTAKIPLSCHIKVWGPRTLFLSQKRRKNRFISSSIISPWWFVRTKPHKIYISWLGLSTSHEQAAAPIS